MVKWNLSFWQTRKRASSKRGEIATAAILIGIGIMAVGAVVVGRLANQNPQTATQDIRTQAAVTPGTEPNCFDITGPVTVFPDEQVFWQATFTSPTTGLKGNLFLDDLAHMAITPLQTVSPYSPGNPVALALYWKPTLTDALTNNGGHAVYCRAINSNVAECRPPGMVDQVPGNQIACSGPALQNQPGTTNQPIWVAPGRHIIPNCSLTALSKTQFTVGETISFSGDFRSTQGMLEGEIFLDGKLKDGNYRKIVSERVAPTTVTQKTIIGSWKPTAADVGTHTVQCRAWYDGKAECRPSNLVDKNPRFPCAGPNVSQTFTVVAPPPTKPTSTVATCQTYCSQQIPGSTAACVSNAGLCPPSTGGGISLDGIYCGGATCCCTPPGPAPATPPPAINCSVALKNATEIDPASASHQFQANVTGGYPPYTYQWRIYDGNGKTVDQIPYQTNSIYTWNLQSKPFTPGSFYIFAYVDIKDTKGNTKTNCTPAAPQVRGASQLCAPCTSSTYCESLDPSRLSYCSGGRCSPVIGAWCPVAPAPTSTPVPPAATSTPIPIPVQCGQACTGLDSCPAGTECSTATSTCQASTGYVCTDTPLPPTATPTPTVTSTPTPTGVVTPTPISSGVWAYTLSCNSNVTPATFTHTYTDSDRYRNHPYYISIFDKTSNIEQELDFGPQWNNGGGFGGGGSGQLGGFFQIGHTYRFLGIFCLPGTPCAAGLATPTERKQQAISLAIVKQEVDNVSCAGPAATPTPTPVSHPQPVRITITNPSTTGEYKIKVSKRETSQNIFTECFQADTATSPAAGDCTGLEEGKRYVIQVVGIKSSDGTTVTASQEQHVNLVTPPAGTLPDLIFSVTLPTAGCPAIPSAPMWPVDWITRPPNAGGNTETVTLYWTPVPDGTSYTISGYTVVITNPDGSEFNRGNAAAALPPSYVVANISNSTTYGVSVVANSSCGTVSPALTGIIYPSAAAPTATPIPTTDPNVPTVTSAPIPTTDPNAPTSTPVPTSTPGPTDTPTPTSTPAPTATPTLVPCLANGGACVSNASLPRSQQDPNRPKPQTACTVDPDKHIVSGPQGAGCGAREDCCMPRANIVTIAEVPFCAGKNEGFYNDSGACTYCAGRLVIPLQGNPTWGSASVEAAKCEITQFCEVRPLGWYFENKAAKSCYYCWGTKKGESYGYIAACPAQKVAIDELGGTEETGNNVFTVIIKKAGTATSDIFKQIRKFLKLEGRSPGQLFFFFREPWKP